MILYPAIDLRGGQVVRLQQGDFARETVFHSNPVEQAKIFAAEGARWLHLVDLDGAKGGRGVNGEVVRRIRAETELQLQFGGGIRSLDQMEMWFTLGIDRLVIGTLALEQPDQLKEAITQFGAERLVVSLDAKAGQVVSHGWLQASGRAVLKVAQEMQKLGVTQVLHTEISRDGMMAGPDVQSVKELVRLGGLQVIASGGICSWDDLTQLTALGVDGAIIGQAIYTGKLRIAEMMKKVG